MRAGPHPIWECPHEKRRREHTQSTEQEAPPGVPTEKRPREDTERRQPSVSQGTGLGRNQTCPHLDLGTSRLQSMGFCYGSPNKLIHPHFTVSSLPKVPEQIRLGPRPLGLKHFLPRSRSKKKYRHFTYQFKSSPPCFLLIVINVHRSTVENLTLEQ